MIKHYFLSLCVLIIFKSYGQTKTNEDLDSFVNAAEKVIFLYEKSNDLTYFETAIDLFKYVLQENPNHKKANNGLGMLYYNYANHLRSKLKEDTLVKDEESQHFYQSMSNEYFRLARHYNKTGMNK